jgi:hypothetical protein
MPEAHEEDTQLEGPGGEEEVDTHRGPAVGLEEDHQETETNVDHKVYVLPHRIVILNMSRDFLRGPLMSERGASDVQNDNCQFAESEPELKRAVSLVSGMLVVVIIFVRGYSVLELRLFNF